MEVLTGDTFAEALLFCSQQENVSVCVVLDNMRNTKELVKTLWRETGESSGMGNAKRI